MRVLTIGRHPGSDVVVKDKTVGRYHAQIIQHDDGHFSLLDMNSKNGTFINGKRVNGEVRLNPGDVVQVGRATLPWLECVSRPIRQQKGNKEQTILWTTLGSIVGVLATILFVVLLLGSEWNLHRYNTNNINTQALVSFSEDVSPRRARLLLKTSGAQILELNENYNCFSVCAKDEDAIKRLISRVEKDKRVRFAIRNQYLTPHSTNLVVLDDFSDPMSKTEKTTHGRMVGYTMAKGSGTEYHAYNININGHISLKEMTNDFMNACDQMSDDNMNVVNISMGVSKYKDKKQTIEKKRSEYIEDYANELKWYAEMATKCKKQNFVITKSMGNEGEHQVDDAFVLALEKMEKYPELSQTLKDHIILVAAKDTRKEVPAYYSNAISKKIKGVNTIMVDLSDLPILQRGTSAAAPLVANWIAKSDFENANDVIKTINKATETGELVSEETFKETAKNIKKNTNTQNKISTQRLPITREEMPSNTSTRQQEKPSTNPPKQPSQTGQPGIAANLVGTKWVFENGYAAQRRTIVFISSNKAKIIDEDINIWTDRHPPVIHTYDCYYDSAIRRVIIKRKSDMVIPRTWMQFKFERGMMIEDTNPNVEVDYERAN